jgi:tungstate transport system ATP-binding protein
MIVRLERIWKYFGSFPALKDINLNIREGEILSIIGSSGAGKTTLLRIISMLDMPDKGVYYLKGKENTYSIEQRRSVTMVFQKPVIFNTSVYKNIEFGLKVRGVENGEARKRVKEALSMVGLEDYAKRRAKTLSGGEQQRVAIARAVAVKPELIVLDEPTANLDPQNIKVIEDIIKKMAEQGITVVFSTHNMFQAKRIAERVVHLHEGKIVEVGNVKKIFENPSSEVTKKFLSGELFY